MKRTIFRYSPFKPHFDCLDPPVPDEECMLFEKKSIYYVMRKKVIKDAIWEGLGMKKKAAEAEEKKKKEEAEAEAEEKKKKGKP